MTIKRLTNETITYLAFIRVSRCLLWLHLSPCCRLFRFFPSGQTMFRSENVPERAERLAIGFAWLYVKHFHPRWGFDVNGHYFSFRKKMSSLYQRKRQKCHFAGRRGFFLSTHTQIKFAEKYAKEVVNLLRCEFLNTMELLGCGDQRWNEPNWLACDREV